MTPEQELEDARVAIEILQEAAETALWERDQARDSLQVLQAMCTAFVSEGVPRES